MKKRRQVLALFISIFLRNRSLSDARWFYSKTRKTWNQLLHLYKSYGRDMSGILFFFFASCEPLSNFIVSKIKVSLILRPDMININIVASNSDLRTEEWIVRKLHTWDLPTLGRSDEWTLPLFKLKGSNAWSLMILTRVESRRTQDGHLSVWAFCFNFFFLRHRV